MLSRDSNHIETQKLVRQSFREFRFPLNWLVKNYREIQSRHLFLDNEREKKTLLVSASRMHTSVPSSNWLLKQELKRNSKKKEHSKNVGRGHMGEGVPYPRIHIVYHCIGNRKKWIKILK